MGTVTRESAARRLWECLAWEEQGVLGYLKEVGRSRHLFSLPHARKPYEHVSTFHSQLLPTLHVIGEESEAQRLRYVGSITQLGSGCGVSRGKGAESGDSEGSGARRAVGRGLGCSTGQGEKFELLWLGCSRTTPGKFFVIGGALGRGGSGVLAQG